MSLSTDHPAGRGGATALSLYEAQRLALHGSSQAAESYRTIGERLLKQGEPLGAYDVVTDGLEKCPGDLRLRQLQALALARSGAPEEANRLLGRLYREGHTDGETLGLLAHP